jgi:hypothetical protein
MKKQTKLFRSQQGQSIVLVAAVMMSLLALAGLAIDGGNVFLQRRRVQNAADASALAGTRVLAHLISTCEDGDGSDDAQVAQTVNEFSASNGFPASENTTVNAWYVNADGERRGQVGAGAIPESATGVEVQIETTISSYFLQVVGIRTSTLGAEAMAMTGKVTQLAGGILPIAVPVEVVEVLGPDEPFVVLDGHDGIVCQDNNGNGQYDSGSDVCIGDPGDQNSHRGWLNLNYIYNTAYLAQSAPFYRTFEQNVPNRGCGPDPSISTDDGVRGWAGDGCPYPYPIFTGAIGATNGDFIHGSPGARQSSLSTVVETYNGRVAYIPIFDYIYMSDYMDQYFEQPEGIGWPRAGGGGSAYLYHIVGFTAVRVNDDTNDHALAGEFQEAIIGEGMIQPGAGIGAGTCQEGLLHGINLWK